jgi:hypothetical protein
VGGFAVLEAIAFGAGAFTGLYDRGIVRTILHPNAKPITIVISAIATASRFRIFILRACSSLATNAYTGFSGHSTPANTPRKITRNTPKNWQFLAVFGSGLLASHRTSAQCRSPLTICLSVAKIERQPVAAITRLFVELDSVGIDRLAIPCFSRSAQKQNLHLAIRPGRHIDQFAIRALPDCVESSLDENCGFLAQQPPMLYRSTVPPDNRMDIFKAAIQLTILPRFHYHPCGRKRRIKLTGEFEQALRDWWRRGVFHRLLQAVAAKGGGGGPSLGFSSATLLSLSTLRWRFASFFAFFSRSRRRLSNW